MVRLSPILLYNDVMLLGEQALDFRLTKDTGVIKGVTSDISLSTSSLPTSYNQPRRVNSGEVQNGGE